MTVPAVFLSPHPDDETISMGAAIRAHLDAGREVHVVAVTNGGATGAINIINGTALSNWWGTYHNPSVEGYSALTSDTMKTARNKEQGNAISLLGVPFANFHAFDTQQDGSVTVAGVQDLLVNTLLPLFGPASWKSMSYYDSHPDHAAIGQALKNLHDSDPTNFGDARYYVKTADQSAVTAKGISLSKNTVTGDSLAKAKVAAHAYNAWAPRQGMFAVGYHSVAGDLDAYVNDPTSYYHV